MVIQNKELLTICKEEKLVLHFIEVYIKDKHITEEEFLKLSPQQRKNLSHYIIAGYLRTGILKFNQAISLTEGQMDLLTKNPTDPTRGSFLDEYLHRKLIDPEVALLLTPAQIEILGKSGVRYSLENKFISLEELDKEIKMNSEGGLSVANDRMLEIGGQKISLEKILNLEVIERIKEVLKVESILQLLQEGKIALAEIFESEIGFKIDLDERQAPYAKESFAMRCMMEPIAGQILTFKQILATNEIQYEDLNVNQRCKLREFDDKSDTLRLCLEEKVFSFVEYLACTKSFVSELDNEKNRSKNEDMLKALENPAIRNEIKDMRAGHPELSLHEIYERYISKDLPSKPNTLTSSTSVSEGNVAGGRNNP